MQAFKTGVLWPMAASCVAGMLLTSCARAQQPAAKTEPKNIALGKTVTFSDAPNYQYSTDPDDITQLTDGKYSGEGELQSAENSKSLWVQKGTVGWQNIKPVVITIDLGAVQPIAGASFSTAGGVAGVTWPTAIYMAVSDDGKVWRNAGDLTILSRENGAPPKEGYAVFRYVTHGLKTKGRYIAFTVVSVPFVFADEIEVYKGDDAWLSQSAPGTVIADLKAHANQSLITSAAQRRLYDDIATARKEVGAAKLSAAQKKSLLARLDRYADETAKLPPLPPDFSTRIPINETHRGILAVRGEALAAQGFAPLTVWRQSHRYDWLPFLSKPSKQVPAQLKISMLGHQFRSDAFLLTNASGQAKSVVLKLQNAPRGAQSGWLQVFSVAWWDTAQGTPAAEPLIPVALQNGVYTIEVPAGMTRKVWLTMDSSKVPAGAYQSSLQLVSGTQKMVVPFQLNVSKTAMNAPRLSQGMWDYTNSGGLLPVTPRNRAGAIAVMRSHFVDSPWATMAALLPPSAAAFDAQNKLLLDKLDFSDFDQWVALWPGAKRYYVFLNTPDYFAGAKMGAPEFSIRVGNWAKALSAHMKDLGLQPQQLGLLLIDEPYEAEQYDITLAWAKAINAAAPELTLFCDPRFGKTDPSKIFPVLAEMDVICPALSTYETGDKALQKYFEGLRAEGKELWFYQTAGPSWQLDPQNYYRHQAWYAFAANANGQGFWSFSDTGGAPISWNGYSGTSTYFALGFFDKDTVYSSIHWEAVREGVEDYEELAMLRDAITKSHDATWKGKAQKVLDDALQSVTGRWSPAGVVQPSKSPQFTDEQLQKVRAMLNATA